jgi:hypothetical protein
MHGLLHLLASVFEIEVDVWRRLFLAQTRHSTEAEHAPKALILALGSSFGSKASLGESGPAVRAKPRLSNSFRRAYSGAPKRCWQTRLGKRRSCLRLRHPDIVAIN